jgi:zinc-binding alcohol dehydrogenase family protein
MRAVVYENPQPISAATSLIDVDLPKPAPTGRDLLVEVKAISVNPVDTKVRKSRKAEPGQYVQLGYDAAGVVAEVGPDVTLFKVGDEVYYAGVINRPGTNAEFHLVDERIVGQKPKSLGFAEAAALPLTAITAYETLFDRLRITAPVPGAANAVVIIGGAGGVGSIAVQLARQLTDLTVIATASRAETFDWVRSLGAHHVIDHSKPMPAQISALGIGAPGLVFSTTHSDQHAVGIVELIAPQGRFGLIDDPSEFDAKLFKSKAVSINWESMFTRAVYQTADIIEQHNLLNKVAELIDAGKVRTTLGDNFGKINAENLKRAHAKIETNSTKGKIVLEGFQE